MPAEPTTDELFAMLTRQLTQAAEDFDRFQRRAAVAPTIDIEQNRAIAAQFSCLQQITLLLVKIERRTRHAF